ncbi:hypothetical protein ABMA28_014955 [Loxostege sticticalis]|uniref:Uncharacterized protein n=1 Tax=Loxostege sticticalis TaxID=481309 RepID=A0ABD0TDR3_LOXSC
MPKRPYEDSDEEKWEKKLKKYQKKLERKRKKRRVLIYSDSDDEILDIAEIQENEDENILEPQLPSAEQEAPLTDVLPCDEPPSDVPSCDVAPSEDNIDAEFLQALGNDHIEAPVWGDDIISHLSDRWEPILKTGIKKEVKEDLNKKYLFPKNSLSCKPPILNPEISSIVTDASRNRDNRIATKQEQLGHALAALGKAMSGLMTKTMETPQVLQVLNDVGKLVADSHFLETDTRRTLIIPLLDKSFIEPIKDRKRDVYLFGDQLKDFIKSSRGIKKSGQLITPPQTSHLN